MNLELNKEIEVNKYQYALVRTKLSSLIAYREKDGKYFIKPLIFQNHKTIIEGMLSSLEV